MTYNMNEQKIVNEMASEYKKLGPFPDFVAEIERIERIKAVIICVAAFVIAFAYGVLFALIL